MVLKLNFSAIVLFYMKLTFTRAEEAGTSTFKYGGLKNTRRLVSTSKTNISNNNPPKIKILSKWSIVWSINLLADLVDPNEVPAEEEDVSI